MQHLIGVLIQVRIVYLINCDQSCHSTGTSRKGGCKVSHSSA